MWCATGGGASYPQRGATAARGAGAATGPRSPAAMFGEFRPPRLWASTAERPQRALNPAAAAAQAGFLWNRINGGSNSTYFPFCL